VVSGKEKIAHRTSYVIFRQQPKCYGILLRWKNQNRMKMKSQLALLDYQIPWQVFIPRYPILLFPGFRHHLYYPAPGLPGNPGRLTISRRIPRQAQAASCS
jgi:hypothetical protein